ncbi:hypothetical protein GLOIN_2v1763880 [Rhizophagus irregularis DAOM 181602=DAOM 197198]|uniref:Uncharacterized protein n=1 Tax=Rhizophagus irregularis (strain DAOM 181602 / DAOM 197198 / MUCL 43194) TaxID=747089 RepID=A0A2P4QTQ4_RHIID|nr:hypothetical protein GLOIN_2v1763880 [Rhizophagus irregularis DAOM 181602=DAOM 197198]POG80938.1 hypothetical protein GLOIN_2v1763880 [Rhizophagus irregularis DAOM 181602=DAOM 197198]|eukprot:XP_025187804.1 hypothetical protein GLOIN_2v1763880 [Rhizophagus irregularis DAOM 181602=DAOM 197198]
MKSKPENLNEIQKYYEFNDDDVFYDLSSLEIKVSLKENVKAEKDGKKPTWPPQASKTKEQKSEALSITKKSGWKIKTKQKRMKKIKLKLMDKGVKLENGKNIRITQQFQIEEESSEKSTDKRRYKDGEIPELYFSSNSWDYNSNILHCCRSWRLGDWANLRVLQSKLRVPMTDTDISLYSELKKNLASIALSDVARSRGKHGYF